MNHARGALRGAVTTTRRQVVAIAGQSERTLMLGMILLLSAVSVAMGYFLAQLAGADLLTSHLFLAQDCTGDWSAIGRHCFGDYAMVIEIGMQSNPWDHPFVQPPDYRPVPPTMAPAAGLVPHVLFALPAAWLGAPRLGLICYLLALTAAVVSPAVWAARGARGLERVVVLVALSAAAIPAWAVIDRGNSAGFVVPIGLVFLVALCRRQWGLVAIMVILAALVKPQFVVLAVALFAMRKWRLGGLALVGVAISNLAAYLLWPRDFPGTLAQSLGLGSGVFPSAWLADMRNVSFGRALMLVPDLVKGFLTGQIPDGFLAGPRAVAGYAVLVVIVVAVLALGRRIPPVMVGIVLLASAVQFPPFVNFYYLVFVLPIAALVVRDPNGPPGAGIFDQFRAHGDRRRAVGICVSLAAALSIAQVALPTPLLPVTIYEQFGARGVLGTTLVVLTTVIFASTLWLITCALIIVSYSRRPALPAVGDEEPTREGLISSAASSSSRTSDLTTKP